jgi:hypothetical protein
VHAAIVELEEKGFLQHERQFLEGRQRSSRYRLLDGLVRGTTTSPTHGLQVSEEADSAVIPADTEHDEGFPDSLSAAGARESRSRIGDRQEDPATPTPAESPPVPVPVPEDWTPSSADADWARARHPALDIAAFTENFVLSCRAKGYRYADISAAWRRWLNEPKGRLPLIKSRNSNDDRTASRRTESQQHRRPPFGNSDPGLSDRNETRAAACLERIMARRAGGDAPGFAGGFS